MDAFSLSEPRPFRRGPAAPWPVYDRRVQTGCMSAPLTVTHLARTCRLSRGTLLYYESIGLLPRPRRTRANYRA